VKNFLQSLLRKLRSRSVYDVQGLYEDDFNDISDRYFKNSPWPSAADVSSIVDNGTLDPPAFGVCKLVCLHPVR